MRAEMMSRRARDFVRLGKRSGGSGGELAHFQVLSPNDYPDSVVCKAIELRSGTLGDTELHVAKPWNLRRSTSDGQTLNGIAYVFESNVRRTATQAQIVEPQVIVPAYYVGQVIVGTRRPRGGTGVLVEEKELVWQQISAQEWAAEAGGASAGNVAGVVLDASGVQNNLNATRDPGTGDDERAGYTATSIWRTVSSNAVFMCVDAAQGAAVWMELTAGLSAAVRRRSHILRIDNPTASDDFEPCYIPAAANLTRVVAVTNTGTVDFNIEKRATLTPETAGTNVWSSDKQATSSGINETAFDSGAIAADTWLHVDISAVSGSPARVRIAISYETGA